jgi:FixJ family two-component response regulator
MIDVRDTPSRSDPAVVVVGARTARTRAVLQALAEFENLVWPESRGSALPHCLSEATSCLVIADDLPEEPATEILMYVRERRPELPIFLVTDSGDLAEAVFGMRAGATAVVEVPPSANLLREYVLQALR